ncbi:MAG: biotin transporter BioY, partial [Dehalococcoidia bacterium]|nr:biotin transporter BioY [Dehalococcoidia bacterium]
GWDRSLWRAAIAMVVGNLIIYGFGLLWLSRFVPFPGTFAAGLFPFLVGDALKIAVATALLPLAWRVVTMAGLGRQ